MKGIFLFFLGLIMQSLVTALLIDTKTIDATVSQQLYAGLIFCGVALLTLLIAHDNYQIPLGLGAQAFINAIMASPSMNQVIPITVNSQIIFATIWVCVIMVMTLAMLFHP